MNESVSGAPVLKPVVPSTVDTGSLNNLYPTNNGSISFTQNGTAVDTSIPYLFAEANVTYQYPTVVLPNSAYISSVLCEPYGLDVNFNSAEAYNYVETHWSTNGTNGTNGFLLVTDSLHCNAADDGVHVFWLVSNLTFVDSNHTVQVTATEVAVENAYDQVGSTASCP